MRLLLELKDKFTIESGATGGVVKPVSAAGDILNALLALGYKDKEAASAVKLLDKDISVTDGIRQALKLLTK